MANHIQPVLNLCLLLTAAVLLIDPCSASSHRKFHREASNKEGFVHLGHADGVDYYADQEQFMSWYAANEYCKHNNMTLAKVMTKNQGDLLRQTMIREHWTSARYSELPSSLVWDDMPHTHPSEDVIPEFNMVGALASKLFCGAITSYNPNGLQMVAYMCSREVVYPLCQV